MKSRAVRNCPELREKLKDRSIKDGDCWIIASTRRYAMWSFEGESFMVHRLSYAAHVGAVPADICVLHRCDNTHCINPAHLFLGTQHDNVMDCVRKDRRVKHAGETHPGAKLTELDVVVIKKLLRHGDRPCDIARFFDVTPENIIHIRNGNTWDHVKLNHP